MKRDDFSIPLAAGCQLDGTAAEESLLPRIAEVGPGSDTPRDAVRITAEGGIFKLFRALPKTASAGASAGATLAVVFDRPVDLAGRVLRFEAATGGAAPWFEVRFFDRDGRRIMAFGGAEVLKPAQWIVGCDAHQCWYPFAAMPGFCAGLPPLPGAASPAGDCRIGRIEFHLSCPADRYAEVRQLQLLIRHPALAPERGERLPSLAELAAVPRLPSRVVLVRRGRPAAALLHPDTASGRAAARTVNDAVERATGVRLPSRPGRAADGLAAGNVVMLGNAFDNPALITPAARGVLEADRSWPGRGRFVLETVFEPIARGGNFVIAGASDGGGLRRAAAALAEAVAAAGRPGELALPRLWRATLPKRDAFRPAAPDHLKQAMAAARRVVAEGTHQSLAGELARIAGDYRKWRRSADAKRFAAVARYYGEVASPDARRYGGPWGFDSDFAAIGVIAGWDLVEHDPALSAADRLAVVRVLARWIDEAVRRKSDIAGNLVAHNHATFAAVGTMFAAIYFEKNFGPGFREIGDWKRAAEQVLGPQRAAFKVDEDCNSYQWLTWHHLLRYTLAAPDDTVFANGVADRMLRYLALTMDNDGYQAPYGDTGDWRGTAAELTPLSMAHCRKPGELTRFLLERKRRAWGGAGGGAPGFRDRPAAGDPVIPEDLLGVQVFPLDPHYRATFPPALPVAEARCFDKISLRAGGLPDDFYCLIDGVGNGGHGHADQAAVLRLNAFGRQWIADADYYRSQAKFHNTLLIFRDGEWFEPCCYSELAGREETAERVWLKLRTPVAGGAVWTRHFVWLRRESALLVGDEVAVDRASELILRQRWYALGAAETPDPAAVVLRQRGAAMRLATAAGTRQELSDAAEYTAGWANYFGREPRRSVRVDRIADGRAAAGGRLTLFSLWCDAGSGAELTPLADGGVRLRLGTHDLALAAEPGATELVLREGPAVRTLPGGPAAPSAFAPDWPVLTPRRSASAIAGLTVRAAADAGAGRLLLGGERDGRGELRIVDEFGRTATVMPLASPVNDIAPLTADGETLLLAAEASGVVRAFAEDGRERWRFAMPFYRIAPSAENLTVADIDGDGAPEVLAGGASWKVFALDRAGRMRWDFEVVRESRIVRVADIDGDGVPEIICGTRYYTVSCLRPDGSCKWTYNLGSTGCRDIALPSAGAGSAERRVVLGGDGGLVHFLDADGTRRTCFAAGDEVFALAVDGERVYAGSYNGFVYRFEPDGCPAWRTRLGESVTALLATADGLWIGTAAGSLFRAGRNGRILGRVAAASGCRIVRLLPAGTCGVRWAAADGSVGAC